jgi:hypothetical protein
MQIILGNKEMHMNYARIALASLGAIVAYFVYGFAMFAAWPSMKTEFLKYPNVYRPKDEMMKVMPYGMIAILIAIVVVAVLYAKIYTAGGGIVPGLCLERSSACSPSAPSPSTTTSTCRLALR